MISDQVGRDGEGIGDKPMNNPFKKLSSRTRVIGTIIIMYPLLTLAGQAMDQMFNPTLYITPTLKYSVIGKGLALMYEPQMISMVTRINQEIKSDRFEMIDTSRSPMASIGFFSSPTSLTPTARFLGVTARVNISLTYFPDNDAGRLGDAMDAFGKDLLNILGGTLGAMQDLGVRGAVLILIYSKAQLNDPDYFNQAEAIVMFIPRDALQQFNSFKIRFDKLFEQCEFFSFKGQDQIQILFNEFLSG